MSRPGVLGWQPPHTYSRTGRYRFHAFGCSVDGGPGLRHGICRKCAQDQESDVEYQILRDLDKYAGATR